MKPHPVVSREVLKPREPPQVPKPTRVIGRAIDSKPLRPSVKSLVRACTAAAVAAYDKESPVAVINREWPTDIGADWLTKTSVAAISTGSAPSLLQTLLVDFLDALDEYSAGALLLRRRLQLSFTRNSGRIAVPTIFPDETYAKFVAEGEDIPVVQGHVEPAVILEPKKLATIIPFTDELMNSSNVEALMQDALLRSVGLALDRVLFDANPGDAARPPGLRYGVSPLTASSAPDATDALIADVAALDDAIGAIALSVMSPPQARVATLRTNGQWTPIFPSSSLFGTHDVIAIAPQMFVSAFGDLPEISAARMAVVQLDPSARDPQLSTWQMNCVVLKLVWYLSWGMRAPGGVAWMTATNW